MKPPVIYTTNQTAEDCKEAPGVLLRFLKKGVLPVNPSVNFSARYEWSQEAHDRIVEWFKNRRKKHLFYPGRPKGAKNKERKS